MTTPEMIDWLRKVSVAIYTTTPREVADDIGPKIREAADLLASYQRKLSVPPTTFQHRWRLPLGEDKWSKWSGWRNGPVKSRMPGWEYEERALYVL